MLRLSFYHACSLMTGTHVYILLACLLACLLEIAWNL